MPDIKACYRYFLNSPVFQFGFYRCLIEEGDPCACSSHFLDGVHISDSDHVGEIFWGQVVIVQNLLQNGTGSGAGFPDQKGFAGKVRERKGAPCIGERVGGAADRDKLVCQEGDVGIGGPGVIPLQNGKINRALIQLLQ